MAGAATEPARAQSPVPFAADASCPPHLTRLFAPPAGVAAAVGVEYLVCRSSRSIDELRPASWSTGTADAGEAFAGASREVRRGLAMLYGGQPVRVARGWIEQAETLDSYALIAPPPGDSLDRIDTGTLIVRTRIRRQPATGGL